MAITSNILFLLAISITLGQILSILAESPAPAPIQHEPNTGNISESQLEKTTLMGNQVEMIKNLTGRMLHNIRCKFYQKALIPVSKMFNLTVNVPKDIPIQCQNMSNTGSEILIHLDGENIQTTAPEKSLPEVPLPAMPSPMTTKPPPAIMEKPDINATGPVLNSKTAEQTNKSSSSNSSSSGKPPEPKAPQQSKPAETIETNVINSDNDKNEKMENKTSSNDNVKNVENNKKKKVVDKNKESGNGLQMNITDISKKLKEKSGHR